MKWRQDFSKDENVITINNVSFAAQDVIKQESILELSIYHVHSFHGKGFMASVHIVVNGTDQGVCCNGSVFPGVDENAYNKALEEGTSLFNKKLDELEKSTNDAVKN